MDLLARVVGVAAPGDMDSATELCAELGCLPLAIDQSGAYLAQTSITPRQYLDLLSAYPAQMYQATGEGGDAGRTVARIWHLTLDRLADTPLAGDVLRILAWYASEQIPRALLNGLADPPALVSAVGRLTAYSMLTAAGPILAVHRLVQAVTHTPEPGDPHRYPAAIATARDQATRLLPLPSRTRTTPQSGRAGGICSRTSAPWPATPTRTLTPKRPLACSVRPECSPTARARSPRP